MVSALAGPVFLQVAHETVHAIVGPGKSKTKSGRGYKFFVFATPRSGALADPCGRTAAQVEHPEGFDIVIWPLQLASLTFFSNWNGRDYDFYFTVRPRDWNANAKSFLIKTDHAGPSLRLLYRKYLILLSGVLDAAATHCLYVRIQSATNASEGIILRDLRDNTEVAIDQSRIGSYFAPHFYRDGVLFCSHDDSGAPISAAATTSA